MVRQEIGIRKKSDKKTEDASMGFGGWVNKFKLYLIYIQQYFLDLYTTILVIAGWIYGSQKG